MGINANIDYSLTEVSDITEYAKKYDERYNEFLKILFFPDGNGSFWLGKIKSSEEGVIICVSDVFDFDSSILSALSSGDKKEALYQVLEEDLEDWVSVDTAYSSTEEAEKNFISTVEEF